MLLLRLWRRCRRGIYGSSGPGSAVRFIRIQRLLLHFIFDII